MREIGLGASYLDQLNLDGEKLRLNATDGDIVLGGREWMKLNRTHGTGWNLTVNGHGTVSAFILGESRVQAQRTGEGNRDVHLHVGKGSTVHVSGERSQQLLLFGSQTMRVTVAGCSGVESSFDGVNNAPAGPDGTGSASVKRANVHGAILMGNLTHGESGQVHFDHGLADESIELTPGVSRVEFLIVTENQFRASPR